MGEGKEKRSNKVVKGREEIAGLEGVNYHAGDNAKKHKKKEETPPSHKREREGQRPPQALLPMKHLRTKPISDGQGNVVRGEQAPNGLPVFKKKKKTSVGENGESHSQLEWGKKKKKTKRSFLPREKFRPLVPGKSPGDRMIKRNNPGGSRTFVDAATKKT